MVEEAPNFKPACAIEAENGPICPECGSARLYKDGLRYLADGSTVQRYLCRECAYRFCWPKREPLQKTSKHNLKTEANIKTSQCSSRALALLEPSVEGAMSDAEQGEKRAAGATRLSEEEVKGKILEFAWWLKKQGHSDKTIQGYVEMLKLLAASGANIFEPESVKESLARLEKGSSWRHAAVCAYSKFAEMHKLHWEKPKVNRVRLLPFIPLERELDDLIAAANKKTACFLQLLKETGMRAGEAIQLKWTDVDFESRTITLNAPEKGGNPRAFKVSPKLIEMLNCLPRKMEKIFPVSYTALKCNFLRVRRKLAHKLQNPRLLQISFHTFRHWKATMEYHKTRDPLYVKELLGHKKLDTTLLYIQIEKTLFQSSSTDEFTVKIAKTPEEIQSLLAVGFEWVGVKDGLVYLRKRV
jgi:integrase/DNA-directed RNA polymerase subunit RPC12/RpoP